MKIDEVPQDQLKSFEGQRKPLYVLDDAGKYTTQLSSGWEAEEVVLEQALAEFDVAAQTALGRVDNGLASPLEYHMYRCRMDHRVLAQSSGKWLWQVRRHCRASVFARMKERSLQCYADALGMTVTDLRRWPPAESQS